MCDLQDNVKATHSFYDTETRSRHQCHTESSWRSDVNLTSPAKRGKKPARSRENTSKDHVLKRGDSTEYYKRYEHDEIPVKDDPQENKKLALATKDSGKASLTNSDLEKLENKIYKNISQELQTDDSSVSSLESNIKFFKTTVQEIFDKFYTSMQDFEQYKQRFDDILAKNRVDSIADMEDFIKDMIQHIMSSDSNLSHESRIWTDIPNFEDKDKEDASITSAAPEIETEKLLESLHSVVEAYKNENYLTDSTLEDKPSNFENCTKKEEIFNIYLLSGVPCVQIKMNDRNLLSEINIKDEIRPEESHVASAENLKKLAAKRQELETYVRQQQESHAPDREIPVKVSFAKKNIYLNEDFNTHERERDDNRSLMSKICSYICKKFRKT